MSFHIFKAKIVLLLQNNCAEPSPWDIKISCELNTLSVASKKKWQDVRHIFFRVVRCTIEYHNRCKYGNFFHLLFLTVHTNLLNTRGISYLSDSGSHKPTYIFMGWKVHVFFLLSSSFSLLSYTIGFADCSIGKYIFIFLFCFVFFFIAMA